MFAVLLVHAAVAGSVLGSTALHAEVTHGIGGLIGSDGAGPRPRETEGWAALAATEAATERLRAARPLTYGPRESRQLAAYLGEVGALEAALIDVVTVGAARPGLAALTRYGDLQLDVDRWLHAEVVPPRYSTPAYARWVELVRGLGLPAPLAWRPPVDDPIYRMQLCDCGGPSVREERAVAAYAVAVQKARELGLAGTPDALRALSALERLRPADYAPRWEVLPAPFGEAGWETGP